MVLRNHVEDVKKMEYYAMRYVGKRGGFSPLDIQQGEESGTRLIDKEYANSRKGE